MGLNWLKLYDIECVLAGRWNYSEGVCHEKCRETVKRIQSFKEKLIYFDTSLFHNIENFCLLCPKIWSWCYCRLFPLRGCVVWIVNVVLSKNAPHWSPHCPWLSYVYDTIFAHHPCPSSSPIIIVNACTCPSSLPIIIVHHHCQDLHWDVEDCSYNVSACTGGLSIIAVPGGSS